MILLPPHFCFLNPLSRWIQWDDRVNLSSELSNLNVTLARISEGTYTWISRYSVFASDPLTYLLICTALLTLCDATLEESYDIVSEPMVYLGGKGFSMLAHKWTVYLWTEQLLCKNGPAPAKSRMVWFTRRRNYWEFADTIYLLLARLAGPSLH